MDIELLPRQLICCSFIHNHDGIRMQLQCGSSYLRGNGTLYCFGQHVGFLLTIGQHQAGSCLKDGTHAHSDRKTGNILRLLKEAHDKGYNAVCNLRLEFADVGGSASQTRGTTMAGILASGTAYRLPQDVGR